MDETRSYYVKQREREMDNYWMMSLIYGERKQGSNIVQWQTLHPDYRSEIANNGVGARSDDMAFVEGLGYILDAEVW